MGDGRNPPALRPKTMSLLPSRGGKRCELTLWTTIGSGPEILERRDMQGIQGYNLAIPLQHRQGAWAEQHQFGMSNGIFAAIRGVKRVWVRPRQAEFGIANRRNGRRLIPLLTPTGILQPTEARGQRV